MTVTLVLGAIALSLALAVVLVPLVRSSGAATGVAKSLALIEAGSGGTAVAAAEAPATERLLRPILHRTRRLGALVSPKGTEARLARQLDRAGNPAFWSLERVMAAKGLGFLVGLALGALYTRFTAVTLVAAPALAAGLSFLPDLLLYNAALKRQEQFTRGLAEALDMLTVCVEAGQGFDSAILQVARRVKGPISGEFARVLAEIQMGKPRAEAFAAMGERAVVPEVKAFVSALTQADRLGLPIANVLREQTGHMRVLRRQKMEEKAQKVTVKILFPLLFCIFPSLFVVIVGPGGIRMMSMFSQM